jgi:DNA repair photolyase
LEACPDLAIPFDILYPACDTDLFARGDATSILRRAAEFARSLSVSTKAALDLETVRELKPISAALMRAGAVLKVGVSFATKRLISQIEPGTADYLSRLRTLERLAEGQINRCAVLKPIIAEIPPSEYGEILEDVSEHVQHILIGGEYLDSKKCGHERRLNVFYRDVNWIANKPVWPMSYPQEHRSAIIESCRRLGLTWFDSDLDLMHRLIAAVQSYKGTKSAPTALAAANTLFCG